MSEYQYYEFQAIDRPLTNEQQQGLRGISSRARITPTRFVNEYNYGDLHADPVVMLEKFFDAFCYVANWGTRRLMFRIPANLIAMAPTEQYCADDFFTIRRKGKYLILEFSSESEDYEWEEGEGWLSSMISLRADLIRGDFRSLYLAWLLAAQEKMLDDDEIEPPVPAGLADLNGTLTTFAQFIRLDHDLIAVAAMRSDRKNITGREEALQDWIHGLAPEEKDEIIFRLINGNEPHLSSELHQRFIITCDGEEDALKQEKRRSAAQLLADADRYSRERKERETREKARKQVLLKKEKAAARVKYVQSLAGREEELWQGV